MVSEILEPDVGVVFSVNPEMATPSLRYPGFGFDLNDPRKALREDPSRIERLIRLNHLRLV